MPPPDAPLFFDVLDAHGDSPALLADTGEILTYAGLAAVSAALAGFFPQKCVVFCLCDNSFGSVAGYLGLLRARAVPLLLGKDINPDLLAALIATYRPSFLWLPRDRAAALGAGAERHAFAGHVLVEAGYEADYPIAEDLALLMTTSGSTGSPKLVRQSYRNIASNVSAISRYLSIGAKDRPITTLPMHYTYGLSILNSHLLQGCGIALTNRSLMDRGFWDHLRASEATTFGGVPYTYEMLRKLKFERMDLPSLRVLTQAGGALGAALAAEFAGICDRKGLNFFVMYGQVEATARISYLPSDFALSKAGSIGIAIPGGELWLEEADGSHVAGSGAAGELVYRGDNVTMGYAECAEDLARGYDHGDVLRTGDLARRDEDGFYTIVGRKKRFVKLFGNRVNLDDVERLITAFGYACACAGDDSSLRVYTTDADHHAEIKAFIAGRTGIHPSAFEVRHIEALPRNAAGKILYTELK